MLPTFDSPTGIFRSAPANLSRVVSVHNSRDYKIHWEIFMLLARMGFNATRYTTSNIKVNGRHSPDELPAALCVARMSVISFAGFLPFPGFV